MRKAQNAFTLFEVLMALGVFGIAVVGMMVALNGALQSAREVRIGQVVRMEINNRLAQLEAEKPQELERRVELDSPKITFIETIRREEVKGSKREVLGGFWRLEVLAKWKAGQENREELASYLVYAP